MDNTLNVTVLYVDDEQINLFLFGKLFANLFTIVTASSGEEGIEKLAENSDISVVISDMVMGGMNGVEFIAQIKKERPELICFILTAYTFDEQLQQAKKDNLISNVFSKPYDKETIHASIKSILEA